MGIVVEKNKGHKPTGHSTREGQAIEQFALIGRCDVTKREILVLCCRAANRSFEVWCMAELMNRSQKLHSQQAQDHQAADDHGSKLGKLGHCLD